MYYYLNVLLLPDIKEWEKDAIQIRINKWIYVNTYMWYNVYINISQNVKKGFKINLTSIFALEVSSPSFNTYLIFTDPIALLNMQNV